MIRRCLLASVAVSLLVDCNYQHPWLQTGGAKLGSASELSFEAEEAQLLLYYLQNSRTQSQRESNADQESTAEADALYAMLREEHGGIQETAASLQKQMDSVSSLIKSQLKAIARNSALLEEATQRSQAKKTQMKSNGVDADEMLTQIIEEKLRSQDALPFGDMSHKQDGTPSQQKTVKFPKAKKEATAAVDALMTEYAALVVGMMHSEIYHSHQQQKLKYFEQLQRVLMEKLNDAIKREAPKSGADAVDELLPASDIKASASDLVPLAEGTPQDPNPELSKDQAPPPRGEEEQAELPSSSTPLQDSPASSRSVPPTAAAETEEPNAEEFQAFLRHKRRMEFADWQRRNSYVSEDSARDPDEGFVKTLPEFEAPSLFDETNIRVKGAPNEEPAKKVELVDFGHGLSLTAEEIAQMNSLVDEQQRKRFQPVPLPVLPESLLFNSRVFLETFQGEDVLQEWIYSTRRTHSGRAADRGFLSSVLSFATFSPQGVLRFFSGKWKVVERSPWAVLGDRGLMAATDVSYS